MLKVSIWFGGAASEGKTSCESWAGVTWGWLTARAHLGCSPRPGTALGAAKEVWPHLAPSLCCWRPRDGEHGETHPNSLLRQRVTARSCSSETSPERPLSPVRVTHTHTPGIQLMARSAQLLARMLPAWHGPLSIPAAAD